MIRRSSRFLALAVFATLVLRAHAAAPEESPLGKAEGALRDGRWTEARRLFEVALSGPPAPAPLEAGRCLKGLGNVLALLGRGFLPAARESYRKAARTLASLERTPMASEAGLEMANLLNDLAVTYVQTRSWPQARSWFQLARDRYRTAGKEGGEVDARINLATVDRLEGDECQERGQTSEAAGHWKRARIELGAVRAHATDARSRGAAQLAMGAVLLRLGEARTALVELSSAAQSYREAGSRFGEAQARSAIGTALEQTGSTSRAIEALADSCRLVEGLREAQHGLRERAAFFEQSAFAFENLIQLLHRAGRPEEAFQAVERAKARGLLDLMGTAGQGSAPGAPTAATTQAGLADVQAVLPQNTAVLEYYVGHASAFAMVVKPGALHVVRLPATPAEIFTAVQETVEGLSPRAVEDGLKAMLDAPDFDSERYDRARQKQWAGFRRQQRESSGKLHSMLIRPVEPALSGAHELVLVPHGVLHHLPFALLAPAGEPAATLLDRFTMTVAPSATAWLRGHTTQAATIPSRALLLSSPQFPPEFPPLTGADAEAEKLRTMLQEAGSAVMGASGRAATETYLRLGWGQFDLVHLATHGELNPASPLESRILLSPGEGHDGNLQVGEVLSLPRARGSIQLVVLSACETGKIGSYDEDVTRRFPVGDDLLGLTRAFAVAGARAILASYWKVDDEATAVLIQSFYRHWLSAPAAGKAAALRQAQLEVRKSGAGDGEDGWDLPYYWSAFALHGDGR